MALYLSIKYHENLPSGSKILVGDKYTHIEIDRLVI
jgi:hypothetical protein